MRESITQFVKENVREIHVYPGIMLIGAGCWSLASAAVAGVVVGGLLVYFGAFWSGPGGPMTA